MSATEDATAALAEMRGTPEQATQALAAMTAAYRGPGPKVEPSDPAEAAARLELLASDKDFGIRLLAGDHTARAEFGRLTELAASVSPVDLAMIGVVPEGYVSFSNSDSEASLREMAPAAADLLLAGVSPEAVRQVLEDREVTASEHHAVKQLRDQKFGDATWRAALMAGDWNARRDLTLINIVLSSQIKRAA